MPDILDDPALRLSLGDELMRRRVARWPIVNVIHVLLGPAVQFLRRRLALDVQRGLQGAEQLVEQHLRAVHPADAVQSAFAALQQSSPLLGRLYQSHKLWEAMDAQRVETDLRTSLASTLERQRQVVTQRIAERRAPLGGLGRWLLTVGALLWFPLIKNQLQKNKYTNGMVISDITCRQQKIGIYL